MSKHLELFDTFQIKLGNKSSKGILVSDSKTEIKEGYSLICEVDATHSGTLINNRVYPPESMKDGIKTWTSPYKKPVLVNHDDSMDPIGRVVSAKYLKTDRGLKSMDNYKPVLRESEGYGYQRLTVKVTDPEAIQKILDGRYDTVSVRMSTDHAFCSICNTDWSGGDGPCEHTPGTKYDGKLAYMTTGALSYREVSFVNIPADEYAGVKEAIIAENRDALMVHLYANNDSDKVLEDLSTGENLYALLDSEAEESDDVVAYLIDKSNKSKPMNKEENVKLTELTKDQLKDLEIVKAMVKEAVDLAVAATTEIQDKACAEKVKKMKDDAAAEVLAAEDAKAKVEAEKIEKEAADAKLKDETDAAAAVEAAAVAEAAAKDKKDAEANESEEDKVKREAKEASELEDAKKKEEEDNRIKEEKEAGGDSKKKKNSLEAKDLQDENKKILDENVRINSELHKMVAERLYDLKRSLRKADVVGITTPEARNQKIEELAQRSVDSLKDQINDLIVEQNNAHIAGNDGKVIENPAISQSDLTNEVLEDKKKTREGKQDTLTRLFPKAK